MSRRAFCGTFMCNSNNFLYFLLVLSTVTIVSLFYVYFDFVFITFHISINLELFVLIFCMCSQIDCNSGQIFHLSHIVLHLKMLVIVGVVIATQLIVTSIRCQSLLASYYYLILVTTYTIWAIWDISPVSHCSSFKDAGHCGRSHCGCFVMA